MAEYTTLCGKMDIWFAKLHIITNNFHHYIYGTTLHIPFQSSIFQLENSNIDQYRYATLI